MPYQDDGVAIRGSGKHRHDPEVPHAAAILDYELLAEIGRQPIRQNPT